MRNFIRSSYYVILPLLIVGISLGYTSFILALLAFIPLLFTTTRHTLAVFFFIYGGALGGVIRAMYPSLPLYGMMIVLLGFLLMWDLVFDLLKNHISAIGGIVITLVFFAFFYYLGPKDEYATDKYLTMCTHGIMMVLGYYAFERSSKIDVEGLTHLLLVASICMFAYVISAANIRPLGVLDYNWFREQLLAVYNLGDGTHLTVVNYQQIGMMVLFSLAVYLSQTKIEGVKTIFYIICSMQLIFTSGCRQAILGVAVVIVLRFSVFRIVNINNRYLFKRLIVILLSFVVFAIAFLYFTQNTKIDVVSNTVSEGDYVREAFFAMALMLFEQNLYTGVGLGGFYYITGEVYPHNFFLELLCETGLIGTTSALLLLIIPLIRKKQGLLHITTSNLFLFLILVGTFVRVMVSSDLTESIELFSAVFAISSVKKYSNCPHSRNVITKSI